MPRSIWVSLLLGSLLLALPAAASEVPSDFEDFDQVDLESLLNQVVVTASRFEQRMSESPTATTVIRAEEIRYSAARTIPDLLRLVPGLDVMSATPSDQNVSARSPNAPGSNKMLVLIDGRYAYDDLHGMIIWGTFPISLEEIERIEVIQGPASALYGANAFSGVVNIITKSPADLAGTRLRVYGGEHETYLTDVVHAAQGERIGYKVSAGWNQSMNRDRNPDGFERFSRGNAELVRLLGPARELSLGGGLNHAEYTLLAPLTNDKYTLDGPSTYVKCNYRDPRLEARVFWAGQRVATTALPGRSTDHLSTTVLRLDTYNAEFLHALWRGRGHHLGWGGDLRLLGIDWYLFDAYRRQVLWSGFLYDEYRPTDRLVLSFGGRFDHHPEVRDRVSPRGSLVYLPAANHVLRLSAGTAYRNPSQLETYANFHIPVFGKLEIWAHGSERLEAERTTSVDCGYRGLLSRNLSLATELFYNRLDEIIRIEVLEHLASPPAPIAGIPAELSLGNEVEYDVWGGSCLLETAPVSWATARIGVSVERAFERETGEAILASPRQKISGGIRAFPLRGLSVDCWAQWRDRTEWQEINWIGTPQTRVVPSHTLLNARIGYAVHRGRAELFLSGQDLLRGTGREHPDGMNVGRTVYGGLRIDLAAAGAGVGMTHEAPPEASDRP